MAYILLIIIISYFLFLVLTISFYIKNNNLKTELKFSYDQNLDLTNNNLLLNNEKISHIQKIEQLTCKTQYQEQILKDSESARKESFTSAKAALFDLGRDLSNQLIEVHKQENKVARELSEKNIAASSEKFNSEFERLLNMMGALGKDVDKSRETVDLIRQSLLSPSGAGMLAEITLENILKASGLRASLDFIIQYGVTTLENARLRPDALIFLPSGNLMVIDAKASKFLVDSQGDNSNLGKTMNYHLKSLAQKEYAENILTSLHHKNITFNNIITLMFLPTEQAVEKILEADSNFLQKAWASNIFPVGPAGLMNMLSFARFQISDHRRSENYKIIIEEVRKLLGSISTMAEHSQRLGGNLQNIMSSYDKFAGSFNRNFLTRVKNIQKLGVETNNKTLPEALERYQLVSSKSEIIDIEPSNLQEIEE